MSEIKKLWDTFRYFKCFHSSCDILHALIYYRPHDKEIVEIYLRELEVEASYRDMPPPGSPYYIETFDPPRRFILEAVDDKIVVDEKQVIRNTTRITKKIRLRKMRRGKRLAPSQYPYKK